MHLPELLENCWRQFGVTHRVLGVLVPEIVLDCSRVVGEGARLSGSSAATICRLSLDTHRGLVMNGLVVARLGLVYE